MAVVDVGLNDISGYVSDGAEEFTRTPQMAFTEVFSQPGMLSEEAISASALEELKRPGNAHSGGKADEHVYVVGFDLQLEYFHFMGLRNLAQKIFTMFANDRELKRVLRILRLPHQVERILPDSVAMTYQSFHFSSPRLFCIAHANPNVRSGCANYAAHSLITKERRNTEVEARASDLYILDRNSPPT
jgi:hypothetical protein